MESIEQSHCWWTDRIETRENGPSNWCSVEPSKVRNAQGRSPGALSSSSLGPEGWVSGLKGELRSAKETPGTGPRDSGRITTA